MTKPEEEKLYEKLQYLYESGKFGEIISEYDLLSPETRFPGIKNSLDFLFTIRETMTSVEKSFLS